MNGHGIEPIPSPRHPHFPKATAQGLAEGQSADLPESGAPFPQSSPELLKWFSHFGLYLKGSTKEDQFRAVPVFEKDYSWTPCLSRWRTCAHGRRGKKNRMDGGRARKREQDGSHESKHSRRQCASRETNRMLGSFIPPMKQNSLSRPKVADLQTCTSAPPHSPHAFRFLGFPAQPWSPAL